MSKYYIVSVANILQGDQEGRSWCHTNVVVATVAADSEEQALEDAKQEFIEMLQREEADWSVEEYEDE